MKLLKHICTIYFDKKDPEAIRSPQVFDSADII